jgi:transcriptional regulator with XRE-family HTH domain
MDYKKKLHEIIDVSGLSQQSLADDIGTSLVTLNNWLNGRSTPTRKALLTKIDALYNKYLQAEDKEPIGNKIKYYGPRDLATAFYVDAVVKLLEKFDENKTEYAINDILELHNVYLYVDNLALPKDIENDKLDEYIAIKPKLLSIIRLFFNKIDENNILKIIKDVNFDYHEDLLSLLAKYKRYEEIAPSIMLQALNSSKVAIWSILANKQIVRQYDQDIRTLILSDTENAEYIIQKYFEKSERRDIFLPQSLTKEDIHDILERYINSPDANPNYLQLVAQARPIPSVGIDDKIKLLAKQKHKAWNDNFFKENEGSLLFATEIALSDTQKEAVNISQDSQTTKFTYSRKWLKEHSDNLSALSNFIHIFPIVNKHMLLTLPSYSSQLGVVERFMKVAGREEYPEGVYFQFIDQSTFMQTMMYENFLRSEDKELEDIIAWYFNEYLKDTFGVDGFSYVSSSASAKYLERCTHVFSGMDSVIKQFKLYVENDGIDQELLAITSKSPDYKEIPSQSSDKYVYATESPEIFEIMHYLFSDQSGLTYINDTLKDKDFASLLANHEIKYREFHDYQKQSLDKLIAWGIIKKASRRLVFKSKRQILILKNLFQTEALSYYHYSAEGKAEINAMVSKGWLAKEGSLLTRPEAKYFSYYLNQKEFSNGYDLRNIYMHGTMSKEDKADENKHYKTYIIALRLLIALIIKIDDDFSTKLRGAK